MKKQNLNELLNKGKESMKYLYEAFTDDRIKKSPLTKEKQQTNINHDSELGSITNTFQTFLRRIEDQQQQKYIEEKSRPLSYDIYYWSTFYFLLDQSNFMTGIDFEKRFQHACNKKQKIIDEERFYNRLPQLEQVNPNFMQALESTFRNDPNFINQLLQKERFLEIVEAGKYDVKIRYALSGKEKENLVDTKEIMDCFNLNYPNSRAYNAIDMILCNDVFLDGKFLTFHLVQYGKWKDPSIKQKDELSLEAQFYESKQITLLHDYEKNERVSISLKEVPHFLICGETGSGKTFFSTFLTASICAQNSNARLFILDYKNDESLNQFSHYERYYNYKDCQDGLEKLQTLFSARLNGASKDTYPIIILFDELSSYVNSFDKRADKEKQQKIIAEILMMGRSKHFHLITSTQRPDAELFKLGARMNYSFKYLMGSSCNNENNQKMMFDTTNTDFKACKQGSGFVSINGSEPKLSSVPIISNLTDVYKVISKALSE